MTNCTVLEYLDCDNDVSIIGFEGNVESREDDFDIDLSADNEAIATKGKASFRRHLTYNKDGSIMFYNTNGYNGGAFFNLTEDGSAIDVSDYKYVRAVVKTAGVNPDSEKIFVKAKTASDNYWSSDVAFEKFSDTARISNTRRVVYFDIEEEDLNEVAMIGVQSESDEDGTGVCGTIVYSISFTNYKIDNEVVEDDDLTIPAYDRSVEISADNEAAATKDKTAYRDQITYGDGYVSFINMNGYNGGAFFKLVSDGSAVDMSDYKYVRAVAKTAGVNKFSEKIFVKAKTASDNYWSGSDAFQRYSERSSSTKSVYYFDIEGEFELLDEVAMIGVQSLSDADGTGHCGTVVYSIEFTNFTDEDTVEDDDVAVPEYVTDSGDDPSKDQGDDQSGFDQGGSDQSVSDQSGSYQSGTESNNSETNIENSTLTVNGKVLSIDEESTYDLELTELNETTLSCDSKGAETDRVHSNIVYNSDGSVAFTSSNVYNSGVSYYINPCTDASDLVDISESCGEGYVSYQNGEKDVSRYDYIRLVITSESQMNCRFYNSNDSLEIGNLPGNPTYETYEGTDWIGPTDVGKYMYNGDKTGNSIYDEYTTRTLYIPISTLMQNGVNPSTLTAIALCPQNSGEEVTIHGISFIKVNYSTSVEEITVTSKKESLTNGGSTTLTAKVSPTDATRQIVTWVSSNEELATINYAGTVIAADNGTGDVTFTATATDGSGVTGSITLMIGVDDEEIIMTHVVDLSDSSLSAVGRTGSYVMSNADLTDDGIQFGIGACMCYVDLSDYLESKYLDLVNYDAVSVTYQLKESDGSNAIDTDAEWGKLALVSSNGLDGFSDGIVTSWIQNDVTTNYLKTSSTVEASLTALDADSISQICGFNFQPQKVNDDQYYVITEIKLVVN